MSRSFQRMATVDCSTKRQPDRDASGGKGPPATYLVGLKCTPLDPVDAQTHAAMQLGTAFKLLQTFLEGTPDIKDGDVLVVGSVEYPIKSAMQWNNPDYVHLIVEKLKI